MTSQTATSSAAAVHETKAEDSRQPASDGGAEAEGSTSTQPTSQETDKEGEAGEDLSRCPICQFIEAGECKKPHQDWVACRTDAKAAGKDYIEECQDHFKAFLQCAIAHRDYYEPFLEMLGGLPEDEDGPEEQQEREGQEKGAGEQPGPAAAGEAGST